MVKAEKYLLEWILALVLDGPWDFKFERRNHLSRIQAMYFGEYQCSYYRGIVKPSRLKSAK